MEGLLDPDMYHSQLLRMLKLNPWNADAIARRIYLKQPSDAERWIGVFLNWARKKAYSSMLRNRQMKLAILAVRQLEMAYKAIKSRKMTSYLAMPKPERLDETPHPIFVSASNIDLLIGVVKVMEKELQTTDDMIIIGAATLGSSSAEEKRNDEPCECGRVCNC